jgi:hypothetical protein
MSRSSNRIVSSTSSTNTSASLLLFGTLELHLAVAVIVQYVSYERQEHNKREDFLFAAKDFYCWQNALSLKF